MKCAAVEDDIVRLFGIMLGRKPSPPSYLAENAGRPMRELACRMAASHEFRSKVLDPILSGELQDAEDRELDQNERVWLKANAQLPRDYDPLIDERPTRLKAALALGLRALDATGAKAEGAETAVKSAVTKMGLALPAATRQPTATRPSKTSARQTGTHRLDRSDLRFVWALLGGSAESCPGFGSDAPEIQGFASHILSGRLLTDRLLPSFYSTGDAPDTPWSALSAAERSAWLSGRATVAPALLCDLDDAPTILGGLLANPKSRLDALFSVIARHDSDCADAVNELRRIGELHHTIATLHHEGETGAAWALIQLERRSGGGHLHRLALRVMRGLGRSADRQLLEWTLSDLPAMHTAQRPAEALTLVTGESRSAAGRDAADRIFAITSPDVSIPDVIGSAARVLLGPGDILAVRCAHTNGLGLSDSLAFSAEVGGLICRGSAHVDRMREQWSDGGASSACRFLPASKRGAACQAAADRSDPVIIAPGQSLSIPGARVISPDPNSPLSGALSDLPISDDTPVLMLHPAISYSDHYVGHAVAHFTRLGKPPIVPLLQIEISMIAGSITVPPTAGRGDYLAPLAWLPLSVLSAKTVAMMDRSINDLNAGLCGTREIVSGDRSRSGPGAIYGTSCDPATFDAARKQISGLTAAWDAGVRSQAPPLAPNLVSFGDVRSDATGTALGRRLPAARIIDRINAVFSTIDAVARGSAGPEQLDAIATSGTADLLLTVGQHDRIGPALRHLTGSPDFAAGTGRDALIWVLDLARSSGSHADVAHALLQTARPILSRHKDLLRRVFDFLAGALEPEQVLSKLNECVIAFGPSLSTKDIRRFADIIERYGAAPAASRFLEAIHPYAGDQSIVPRPIRNRLSTAFLRGPNAPPPQMGWSPSAHLRCEERLRFTLADQDHHRFLGALAERLADGSGVVAALDPLRAFALEIAGLGFKSDEIPYHACSDMRETAFMAKVFGDTAMIRTCRGDLPSSATNHLAALLGTCIGDDGQMQDVLSGLAGHAGLEAPRLRGSGERRLFEAYVTIDAPEVSCSDGMVSVIISTLNTDTALLSRSLSSILAQTYQNLEILLIDDGSDPEHAAEIRRVSNQDERIRAFAMPKNLGPYLCRNFAIDQAKGAFIAIQDADDVSHPQRLAHQLETLRNDEAVQLVTSQHMRVDPRGWPQFEHGFELFGDGTMSSLFRRDVFAKLGPFLPVRSRGDVEMRERIRRSFGTHAIRHIEFPLLLCHASAETLSQRTAFSKGAYLQLFRGAVDAIQIHADHIREGRTPAITIPAPLRG